MDDFMEESRFMLNETTTVEDYMHNKLIVRGLNAGEFERAFEYAKKSLDGMYAQYVHLDTKSGKDVLVKDCWNTKAQDYTQEALDKLWRRVEEHAFTWCINFMHGQL